MGEIEDQIPCCSICSEFYDTNIRVPKVLNCGHTLCLDCSTKIIAELRRNGRDVGVFPCTTCRKPTKIAGNGFATNYQLIEALELIDKLQPVDNNQYDKLPDELIEKLRILREKLSKTSKLVAQAEQDISTILRMMEVEEDKYVKNELWEIYINEVPPVIEILTTAVDTFDEINGRIEENNQNRQVFRDLYVKMIEKVKNRRGWLQWFRDIFKF